MKDQKNSNKEEFSLTDRMRHIHTLAETISFIQMGTVIPEKLDMGKVYTLFNKSIEEYDTMFDSKKTKIDTQKELEFSNSKAPQVPLENTNKTDKSSNNENNTPKLDIVAKDGKDVESENKKGSSNDTDKLEDIVNITKNLVDLIVQKLRANNSSTLSGKDNQEIHKLIIAKFSEYDKTHENVNNKNSRRAFITNLTEIAQEEIKNEKLKNHQDSNKDDTNDEVESNDEVIAESAADLLDAAENEDTIINKEQNGTETSSEETETSSEETETSSEETETSSEETETSSEETETSSEESTAENNNETDNKATENQSNFITAEEAGKQLANLAPIEGDEKATREMVQQFLAKLTTTIFNGETEITHENSVIRVSEYVKKAAKIARNLTKNKETDKSLLIPFTNNQLGEQVRNWIKQFNVAV